jgi:hypothetical protein
MGVQTGPLMTTMRIRVGRECVFLLQWMVTNSAPGGRDTVPGVGRVRIQATTSATSRGDGAAGHLPLWTQGTK